METVLFISMKNLKLQLCRQHVLLEAQYFGGWWIDVAPKENTVGKAVILDFFVMPSSL